jgi:E3 ubiquitin-protein ligase SIAH1
MQSESTDLEQNFLIHLECPVSLEYMRPPIPLCANGHKICRICKQKVSRYPNCREQFVYSRNLALEDLARQVMYPCKYRSYGCTETLSHDKIFGHQATCQYIPQVCPFAKRAIGNCSCTGSYNDMKGHLQKNHLEECCE